MLATVYSVALLLVCERLGLGQACFADGQTLICQEIPTIFSPGYSSLVVLIPDLGGINSTMFLSKNLINVTRLTIKGNMTAMVPGALISFQNLQTLILDENALTQIDQAWVSPATSPALKDLSLVGNHIEVLNESMLGGLVGLTRLNLSRNWIRAIGPGSFSLQTNLGSLDLSRNWLTRLSPLVLGSVGTAVLRLAGNPWDCSCGAADFVGFLKDLKNRSLLEQENEVTCSTPTHLRGQPVWNVSVCGTIPSSSSVWTSLSTLPLMTSPTGTSIATNLRPAELNIPTATLYGVMVPLCVLLGLLGCMGGLYGRKRRNRVVKAGPSAEEDPNLEPPSQSQQPRSPSDPMKRDAIETIHWHGERALSINSLSVRAKSANAVLSMSPFSVAVKDSPGVKVSPGVKDSGVKVSPGVKDSPGVKVSPGLKDSPSVQQSEADNLKSQETQSTAEPDVRLETEVERKGRGTSHQEERFADKRVPDVSVYTEEAPYLSIGTVPPKQEAEIADGGPGQRSGTGDVMSRVSSWPLSAAQWQGKGIRGVQGEGPNILTKHTGGHQRENKCKHGTESIWVSRVFHHTTPGGGVSNSGDVSVTAETQGCSAALTSSTTEMLPLGGANGSKTEAVSHISLPASQQGTTDTTDVRVESKSVPNAATPGALCGEDLTVDDNTCSKLNVGTLEFSPLNDEPRVEPRPPGQRISAAGRRGPSNAGDQGVLVMGERRYEDLLHEVVQNQGRWTRDRWRQTHLNKRSHKQQGGDGC